MAETYMLPARLDLSSAKTFLTDIGTLPADKDVVLDAAELTHFGAICVQTVLAAAAQAKSSGGSWTLVNVSDRVQEQLSHMGLTPDTVVEAADDA